MIGKKNIIFGFLYLVLTAALGPYMISTGLGGSEQAYQDKQQPVGRIQALKTNNFEEELEPLNAEQIAKANSEALLALNKIINLEDAQSRIRTTHAHGNLEAVLNILAGLALCFIAVAKIFKQIISWCFIGGALLHSGMLYLGFVFGQGWAFIPLNAGPFVILAGLLLTGIAAIMGFKGEIVKDN